MAVVQTEEALAEERKAAKEARSAARRNVQPIGWLPESSANANVNGAVVHDEYKARKAADWERHRRVHKPTVEEASADMERAEADLALLTRDLEAAEAKAQSNASALKAANDRLAMARRAYAEEVASIDQDDRALQQAKDKHLSARREIRRIENTIREAETARRTDAWLADQPRPHMPKGSR